MKRQFWSVVVCAGLAATAAAQSPTSGEFAGPLVGPGGPGGPKPNAMFTAIDADGDGAITMRELRKAVVALKKLDADKDGKITLAEVSSASSEAAANNAATGFSGPTGFSHGAAPFAPAGGDPRPGGPDLMQYDRNHDGQLSTDEVPTQMMGMLRGADQNGNGKLDPQELQLIQQRIKERVRGQQPLPPGISVGPQGVTRTPQNP